MEEVGIKVACFLIDRPYYNPECTEIAEKPVEIFEDYVLKNECAVIIAYRGYRPEQISDACRKNIKYLFDYDFIGRLVLPNDYSRPITEAYLKDRTMDVSWIYDQLEDSKSADALDDYLYQRIYGNYSKKFDPDQYFQEDIIKLTDREVFVDCGAFQGETILAFIEFAKKQGISSWEKMIAFEPEPANIEVMKKNIGGVSNVLLEQAGVYSETTTLYFNSGDGSNSAITEDGDCAIAVKSIDDVLGGNRATFIKMDVEGSEMAALQGARNTIEQYRPKLAICIYHKREDFIDIPRYIKSLRDDYKFYVRNHDSAGIECVLYAV